MAIAIQNTGVRTLTIFEDEYPYRINKMTADVSIRDTDGLIVVSWWNVGKSSTTHQLSFNFSDVTEPVLGDVNALHDWILNQLENLGGDLSYESPVKVMGVTGFPIESVPIHRGQFLMTEDDGSGGLKWVVTDY